MNTIVCNIKSKKWDYVDLINWVLAKYDIDGVQLTVIEDNKTLDKFSTADLEMRAMLITYVDKMFVLHIRKGDADLSTFCHELIHLHQYYRGDLKALDNFRKYEWKGVIYDSKTDYFDREWEKEAFANANKLSREYKKDLKKRKKNGEL